MQVETRQAKSEDAPFIALLSSDLGYEISVDKTRELINEIARKDQYIIYVATLENEIIGWIQAFITARLESGVFCEIGGMVVSEKHRGMGIGRLLVQEIKNWTSAKMVTVLKVRCNEKRMTTHQFYLSTGFHETKTQKVFVMDL